MISDRQLLDTQRAFDRVAADYDGPTGNNDVVQLMRSAMWRTVVATVPRGGHLLDLGCGTGLDLAHFVSEGYTALGIDSSASMIARTRGRIAETGIGEQAEAIHLGIEELRKLGPRSFDGIYSDLGPLNCVPDLTSVSRACHELLRPGGHLIASVIGRVCPWEMLYYALRGNPRRAFLRRRSGAVAVGLRGETVWTRYFSPSEFSRAFASEFQVITYRSLGLVLPPPYLVGVARRFGPAAKTLTWLDHQLGDLPVARDAGDHFLMVLRRRAVPAGPT